MRRKVNKKIYIHSPLSLLSFKQNEQQIEGRRIPGWISLLSFCLEGASCSSVGWKQQKRNGAPLPEILIFPSHVLLLSSCLLLPLSLPLKPIINSLCVLWSLLREWEKERERNCGKGWEKERFCLPIRKRKKKAVDGVRTSLSPSKCSSLFFLCPATDTPDSPSIFFFSFWICIWKKEIYISHYVNIRREREREESNRSSVRDFWEEEPNTTWNSLFRE